MEKRLQSVNLVMQLYWKVDILLFARIVVYLSNVIDLVDNQTDRSLMTISKKYVSFEISFEYLWIAGNLLFLQIKQI